MCDIFSKSSSLRVDKLLSSKLVLCLLQTRICAFKLVIMLRLSSSNLFQLYFFLVILFVSFTFFFFFVDQGQTRIQPLFADERDYETGLRRPNVNWSDLFRLQGSELESFMAFKEAQYLARRSRITHFCSSLAVQNKTDDSFYFMRSNVPRDSFIYDPKDKVAYCSIAKVGSSTWCLHFIRLAGPSEKDIEAWSQALQLFAPRLWPLPEDIGAEDLSSLMDPEEFTSLLIVRHPLSRLVSVYFQKLIALGQKSWRPVTSVIINKFRKQQRSSVNLTAESYANPEDDPDFASPEEFLLFIEHSFNNSKSMDDIDQHWRPQHVSCPICAVNFTIYAKLEEMDEDSAFFFMRSNLTHRIQDAQMRKNTSGGGRNKEKRFWSKVSSDIVQVISRLYSKDFEFFNYDTNSYFKALGLTEKTLQLAH